MWDRSIVKSNAKVALNGRYWTAFLVTLIFILLAGALNWLGLSDWRHFSPFSMFRVYPIWNDPFGFRAFVADGINLLKWLYIILIVHPLAIGVARYFVRNHFESTKVETMFSSFRWNYGNGVAVLFLTRLFVLLWTCLFVIPGIVKMVQYSMVPFLLSDNPSLPGSRAREISRMMTDGQKGAIFVFWLSFLGWFFLGALCAGVGMLFVLPYFTAAQTELYLFLRSRALSMGYVRPEELCLGTSAPRP